MHLTSIMLNRVIMGRLLGDGRYVPRDFYIPITGALGFYSKKIG